MDYRFNYISHVLSIFNGYNRYSNNTDPSLINVKFIDDTLLVQYENNNDNMFRQQLFRTLLSSFNVTKGILQIDIISWEDYLRNNKIDDFLE